VSTPTIELCGYPGKDRVARNVELSCTEKCECIRHNSHNRVPNEIIAIYVVLKTTHKVLDEEMSRKCAAADFSTRRPSLVIGFPLYSQVASGIFLHN